MKLWPLAIALLTLICSGKAYATEAPNELDYYQELPVVLSASRLTQPLSEAPNAMTVIDRKMIDASGFRSIPDLFKLVPGMYVSYYKGNHAFVGYHGSPDQYARSMQVLIDGRSVYMPPLSMVDWSTLPITMDDIERIEVIRGPAAASHGANSTQGVINIITQGAGDVNGATVSVRRGDKGVNDVIARFGKRGEMLDYRVSLASISDHGFDNLNSQPGNQTNPAFIGIGTLNNSFDDNRSRMLNYRADYHPNAVDNFDLQLGYNHNVKNVGWTDSLSNPIHDLYANSGFLQLGWTRLLADNSELSLRYNHIRYDQHEDFLTALIPQSIRQSVNSARDEIEVQHTVALTPANRLVYGAGYRYDQVASQLSSLAPIAPAASSSINSAEWRVFAHDEWRITPSLLINTGGMYERDRLANEKLSPRIAFNYHFTPHHTFRVGTSVAYRTPALMETNLPAVQPGELFVMNATATSQGIRPERLISREIGYIGEFVESKTRLDMRIFSDLVTNGIFWSGATSTFVNLMSAEYQGFEATIKQSFNENSELTINFAHELASSNGPALAAAGYGTFRSAAPWTNDALSASIPKNSGSLLYSHRLNDALIFSASYYQQGMMQPFDRGATDVQMMQKRTDMRLAHPFRIRGESKGELALVIQNLFNRGYTEYVANNLFNRRGYVTLTLKW